jgi:hypothetical protein
MARAHLLKTITDNAGNTLAGASIRVLRPGTNTPLADPFYGSSAGGTPLSNPFTSLTGVVSIYTDTPQRVTLGVTLGSNAEVVFEDVDVLEPAEGDFQTAAQTPYTSPSVSITAQNVQDALDQIIASTGAGGADSTHAGDGFESTQVGPGAIAESDQSTALGHNADASTFQATALGESASAGGTGSTAVGQAAAASANQASAVGSDSVASGLRATALGAQTQASANDTTAVGEVALATALRATALGAGAHAASADATAVGFAAQATAARAIALGAGAVAATADETVVKTDTVEVVPSSPTGHATRVRLYAADDGAHTVGVDQDGLLFDGAALVAASISFAPVGTIAATDVQAAVVEVESDVQAVATALSDHLADTTDAHDASAISYTPAGSVAATDVQAAITELATEKYGPEVSQPFSTKTADYTLTNADSVVFFSGVTLTATLPTPVGRTGRMFTIKNLDSTALTVTPLVGTIDGDASRTLAQYAVLRVVADGANWGVV